MSTLSRLSLHGLALSLLLLSGCPTVVPEDEPSSILPTQGVKLRLLVVDDPGMVEAIGQLQGEWNAQTGSEYTVTPISLEEFRGGKTPQADAMIVPSAEVGSLAVGDAVLRVPENYVAEGNSLWSEVFTQLRVREAVWGNEVVAVPFGSPLLTCYYRADLLKRLGRKPPRTWQEYYDLSRLMADRKTLADAVPAEDSAWFGCLEPLGPGWAGQMLLARAAAYASHREIESTLFNIDTMEPLIDGPPFVRALEELVAAAAPSAKDQMTYDPEAVRKAFWEGKCAMAITWPSAAAKQLPTGKNPEVGFAELPGSAEVYNLADKVWEKRRDDEGRSVPLLATAGRAGVVDRRAARPEVAFQLLFWLSSDRWGQQVCTASPATTLFRDSQTASPQAWVEKPVSAIAAAQYATLVQQTLNRQQRLLSPRMRGREDYLAALDKAVHQALRGQRKPAEALSEAADGWRKITNTIGIQTQRHAYWQSLGLD